MSFDIFPVSDLIYSNHFPCSETLFSGSDIITSRFAEITVSGVSELVFVIGSSCGLSAEVSARADFKLSMSKMTFLHQFARLILVEQIYRAFKILKGEKYHK